MKSIVVGTAGHIDHGKTALVKALTGIDADRLEEEKRRGITIDLGFAHLDLPMPSGDTLHLGFVDVPGHERFVRNMLAGVGGIDLVLLVIAADESIKPQTREHFDILQLLGVKRGITVITKSDAIDSQTLDVVRLEVEDFLRGTFLDASQAPIVRVSSLTGAGLDELKRAIVTSAMQVPSRDSEALARLPVDRVFTMKGFGTVVTGTLVSGTITKDQDLDVMPGGKRLRVRGVQVHGCDTNQAVAGQRTALNVVGAGTGDLVRGVNLVPTELLSATRVIDTQFHLLKSAPRHLKDRARVHFHSNTMETVAEVVLGGAKEVSRGSDGLVRLKLADPALLLPGDRFIVRQFSPLVTIGGGEVLDAKPASRKFQPGADLETLAAGDAAAVLKTRIARRSQDGIGLSELVSETGWRTNVIESNLQAAMKNRDVVRVGNTFLTFIAWDALKRLLVSTLREFHEKNPLVRGMGKEQLRVQMDTRPTVFDALLQSLVDEKNVEISSDLVHLPGRGVVMKDEEAESKKKIEGAFASAALKVPALNDVIAGLKIDKTRAQKIVTLLLRDKILVKVSDELVFHRSALDDLRKRVVAYKAKSLTMDVANFKELTGVSRKYAIPLLEYLDRERVTKRVGDKRQIL